MRSGTINDLEALKIAIAIEKRGETFYRKAALKVADESIKAMLEDMARDEEEHKTIFQELYGEFLKKKDDFDDMYLYDQEVVSYFNAIADTLVFPDDEEQLRIINNIKDVRDVLRFGIQAEKDSILLYTEMVIYSKFDDVKNVFRKLLREEKNHLIDLQNRLAELTK